MQGCDLLSSYTITKGIGGGIDQAYEESCDIGHW